MGTEAKTWLGQRGLRPAIVPEIPGVTRENQSEWLKFQLVKIPKGLLVTDMQLTWPHLGMRHRVVSMGSPQTSEKPNQQQPARVSAHRDHSTGLQAGGRGACFWEGVDADKEQDH